jgi:streptomycin 6-kinase
VIVPDDLRRTITGWAGDEGRAWLAALPRLVAELADEWSLALGEPYVPSGYTALALRATRADGTPCVLKAGIPDPLRREAEALDHYAGHAAVALLAHDRARDAMLLERCDPGTQLLGEPDDVASSVVADTLAALWAPPRADHPFGTLAKSAARWREQLRRVPDAVDPALRDEVLDLLGWLLADPPPPMVLHGDLHAGNVLRATRRPWLAIDPKGVVGDPAFDLASAIRDRVTPENVRRRFDILTGALPVDPVRVRAWTLALCVESAAWSAEVGDTEAARFNAYAAPLVATLPG